MKMFALALLTVSLIISHSAPLMADHHQSELKGEYLMDLVLETSQPQSLGQRLIVPITGGRFEGPSLKGTILDVGADWIQRRQDGVSELDVRITLQTDDEALIYMTYRGIISREGDSTYWRMVPRFETDSAKYAYLTKMIAVGVGKRIDGKTAYSIYRIL